MSLSYSLLACTIALISCIALVRRLVHKRGHRGLPGPRALPLIGNIHQLPTEYLERTLAQWTEQYGDPIFATFFRTPTLIINTHRVARELLEKRGSIYSSRPRTVLMSEIMQWYTTVLLPYDSEPRRKQRRWIQREFGDKDAIQLHEPIRRRETYRLLLSLMREPKDFIAHVKRFVASILTEITYGHVITSLDDSWFLLMDKAVQGTSESGSAAAVLVDFFPMLKFIPVWMPGAGFKRHALKVKQDVQHATHMTYYAVKEAVAAGTAKPSFVATLITDAQQNGTLIQDERDIMAAAGTIYAAGMDTTRIVLITFILAMVIHPDVLRKAQDEVDHVVGVDRLPALEDRDKLPYIECLIKETLRWSTPTPLGIPHCLTEDDDYHGHTIPKGSTVLTNIWAMTHDEEVYPDASAFRPERFLGMDAKAMDSTDPRAAVFGFGRRSCPGKYYADANIFMAIASIVATLNISKTRNDKGEEITPSTQFGSGQTRLPPEFTCTIAPRSQQMMDLVSELLGNLME